MEYSLTPAPNSAEDVLEDGRAPGDSSFTLSAEPLVAAAEDKAQGSQPDVAVPQSYGVDTLCLMARDPHSLFAFWEIDWVAAFGAEMPPDRTVHLRVLKSGGAEETRLQVEPMARSCNVTVSAPGSEYTAELGYYDSAAVWTRVAVSAEAITPPLSGFGPADAEAATIPFHLSFQSMLDSLRESNGEGESLVNMLSDLRTRVAATPAAQRLTDAQREIVQAIEQAAAQTPPIITTAAQPIAEWSQQKLQQILGFGGSSPANGFGGSSRGA